MRGDAMKRTVLMIVMCILIPLTGYADDSFKRIGVTIGGTALLSFSFERHYGDSSVRVNVGTSVGEIALLVTVNRFFSKSDTKVFTGIGGFNSVVFYKGINHIHLVTVPVGVDCKISDRKYLGLECDMHYFITGRHHDGKKVEFNSPILHKNFVPFPAMYFKYKLSK